MANVTPKQVAAAIDKQQSLTRQTWLARCDELAGKQQVMFLELASYGRDGVTEEQFKELIDFLSVMQYLAEAISKATASPVEMPEFQSSVVRAVLWFKTLQSSDKKDKARMISAWFQSIDSMSEPVIWAWCVNTLKKHGILAAPLAAEICITIYAISDVFSRRLVGGKAR